MSIESDFRCDVVSEADVPAMLFPTTRKAPEVLPYRTSHGVPS